MWQSLISMLMHGGSDDPNKDTQEYPCDQHVSHNVSLSSSEEGQSPLLVAQCHFVTSSVSVEWVVAVGMA